MPLLLPIKSPLQKGELVVNLGTALVGIDDYRNVRLYLCSIMYPMDDQKTEYRVRNDFVVCRFRPSSYSGYRFFRRNQHPTEKSAFFLEGTFSSQPLGKVSGSVDYDDFYACRKFLKRLIKTHRKRLVEICRLNEIS